MSKVLSQDITNEPQVEHGVSEAFTSLLNVLQEAKSHGSEPVSLGWKRALFDVAIEILDESSQNGWDGYNAEPIEREAVIRILELIHYLPESVEPPNLVPSTAGHISLEWHDLHNRVVSVSPKKDKIVWAAILGDEDQQYGKAPFRKGWPPALLNILMSVFSSDRFILGPR